MSQCSFECDGREGSRQWRVVGGGECSDNCCSLLADKMLTDHVSVNKLLPSINLAKLSAFLNGLSFSFALPRDDAAVRQK